MNSEAMKWPTNKHKYDRNYLRLYGVKCPECHGTGELRSDLMTGCDPDIKCDTCDGLGYTERNRHEQQSGEVQ